MIEHGEGDTLPKSKSNGAHSIRKIAPGTWIEGLAIPVTHSVDRDLRIEDQAVKDVKGESTCQHKFMKHMGIY